MLGRNLQRAGNLVVGGTGVSPVWLEIRGESQVVREQKDRERKSAI
jgi:hypothetical protein